MSAQRASASFLVTVDDTELPEEAVAELLEVVVDDELNVPDVVELVFRDPLHEVLAATGLTIGARVKVAVASEADPAGATVFDGEVTALEAELERDRTRTIVRGYDLTHRLQRGTVTETHLDVTYGDVAGRVADRRGLDRGDLGADRVIHEAVVQWNQTDWELLSQLAAEVGHEVVVVDGKLHFREPADASTAPAEGDMEAEDPRQLTAGRNLLRLRATVNAAEQVAEVQVRGWDPKAKEAVEGIVRQSSSARAAASGAKPDELARTFDGGTMVRADLPLQSTEVAGAAARSLAEQVATSAAELDGVAYGNPALRAGATVNVANVGQPFDGRYTLTSCRHSYRPDTGYLTSFRVSGRQHRSLLGLVNGTAGAAGRGVPGVVPGLVSNVDDPESMGRVKVAFPWLSEKAESFWARVVSAGAGPDRGAVLLPEVGDEVLVAFHHGDPRLPYVLGGLHNGTDALPLGADAIVGGGEVKKWVVVSRTAHQLVLDDADAQVRLATGDDGHRLVLSQKDTKVVVHSDGTVEIDAGQDVKITAGGSMTLEATGSVDIKGMGVSVDAGGGAFSAKGVQAAVEGSAAAEVKSGGTTVVRGTLVQIN